MGVDGDGTDGVVGVEGGIEELEGVAESAICFGGEIGVGEGGWGGEAGGICVGCGAFVAFVAWK